MSCLDRIKNAAYILPLKGLMATSDGATVTVSWVAGNPLLDNQWVNIQARRWVTGNTFIEVARVDRNLGEAVLSSAVIVSNYDYILWVRPEWENYCGEWQGLVVQLAPDFSVGVEQVTYSGDDVFFESVGVTSPL